ncbi:AraC family transcriptional regulator [Xylanivirga thermophila]|uniref:AraC family transcriptional regulator n=1 Tax=Xylanivirga thermophila TaxID=2496273 RepID=UPI0013EC8E47|nr:AraC family transcriptional regulator [Xylanivirga thermophila]
MSSNIYGKSEYVFFCCDNVFKGSIPFKIYKLEGNMSGENYHSHEYMQIWYVDKGVVTHWLDGKAYEMVKGDAFVIPPYVTHKVSTQNKEKIKIWGCEFSAKFINSQFNDFQRYKDVFDFTYLQPFLVTEENIKPKINISMESRLDVENAMESMLKEYKNRSRYYDHVIKAELLKLLAIMAREYYTSCANTESGQIIEKYRDNINDVIEYINQNFTKDIKLDDVCKLSAMSKSYFCYIFKNLTSKTFTEYLIDLRINEATDELVNTDLPITEICFKVGFNDVTHFCRTFKKIVGSTPGMYRRSSTIYK